MPTFEAKTADELRGDTEAKPGSKTPVCDPDRMAYHGDGTPGIQVFRYFHPQHTVRDVLRPDYFLTARDRGLRPWDEIHVTCAPDEAVAGKLKPSEARRMILVVEQMPGTRGVGANEPLIVARATYDGRKATPMTHGGEAGDDAKPSKKAA